MKLFFVALLATAAFADKLDNTYLPPNSAQTAGGNAGFLNAPHRPSGGRIGGGAAVAPAASYSGPTAAPIGIIRLNNENPGDGSYRYDFETENRISAQESGQLKNAGGEEVNSVQGSFTYTAPDGSTYSINYIADENGFQPQGDHLPTAPPVPAEILKALEQNAADEAAGIVDDGQYRPSEHGGEGAGAGAGSFGGAAAANRQYLAPKPSGNQQQGGYRY